MASNFVPLWSPSLDIIDGETIANGASFTSSAIDFTNILADAANDPKQKADIGLIQVEVAFDGSVDGNATFGLLKSPDGINFDTEIPAADLSTIEFTISTTKRLSINVFETPYAKIKVNNTGSAGSYTVTARRAVRAWREDRHANDNTFVNKDY